MIENEEIEAWISAHYPKDSGMKKREWFAKQIGSTLNTVNKWFSSGFPEHAMISIERLINPSGDKSAGLQVQFSASQWDEIQEASRLAGFRNHRDFYQATLLQKAREILAEQRRKQEELPLVAEEPAQYGPKGGKHRKGGAQ